jgi:hypothetical protein
VLGVNPKSGAITLSKVRWDRFWYDPHSREPDFSDAKYLGVVVWWDLEDARDEYANKADELTDSVAAYSSSGDTFDPHEDKPTAWFDADRKRIRICEVYYKSKGQWWTSHFTKGACLTGPDLVPWVDEDGETWCPLKACSGFVDEEGYRYGVVRNMVSPQRELNCRRQRALHELVSRKFMFETGAIADPDKFQSELMKADGKMEVMQGALREQAVQVMDSSEMNQSDIALYQDAKGEIDATGPAAPVVAGDQSVMSGRAIMAKQSIGSMELETIFDNLRAWQEDVFRGMWFLIRQTWTEATWLRVTDSKKKEGYRFVAINQDMSRAQRFWQLVKELEVPPDSAIRQLWIPSFDAMRLYGEAQQIAKQQIQQVMAQAQQMGQQLPPDYMVKQSEQITMQALMSAPILQQPMRVNDIAKLGVDIVIDASPDTSIIAQEEFSELMKYAQQGLFAQPQHVQKALLKCSSLRSKDELIEAISRPPDPAQVQVQQQATQVQLMLAGAQVAKAQADAQKAQADAARSVAEAQIAIPAEARKDDAQALNYAATAGAQTAQGRPMGQPQQQGFQTPPAMGAP